MSGPLFAPTGMVASSQRLASAVGVDLLRAGGSAVDAAIGVNSMLSLIEPHMCGPGGDLFAQVWDPHGAELHGLNASGRAPLGQSFAELRQRLGDAPLIAPYSVHAVTVPGAVAGWAALHERFGRLSLAEIFAPVIEHAHAGIEIGPQTAQWWREAMAAATADPSQSGPSEGLREIFLVDGEPPAAGTRFRNPALARCYGLLVEHGLRDFYEGEVARGLCGYLEACGSAVTARDLSQCRVQWVDPIMTTYRGYDVFELPPNGQGLTVLQMLNILERFPLGDYGYGSAEYWHLLIESKKLAFEDRAHYYADPDFASIPVNELADKAYAGTRAALINEVANPRPIHGDPALTTGDTTYLSVADGDGMMVSLIQSIYAGFGAGLAPPDLGFALQSRGAGFSLTPGHANVYAPGKRPFHTIIPAFVMHDGEPLMSFGVMGADMQPQGQVEVLVNLIDFDMDLQAAGDAARMRHDGVNGPAYVHAPDAGIVWHEAACDGDLLAALSARGHDIRPANHLILHFMGGYQCIRREPAGWSGASETRFDGCAAGY